MRVAGLGVVSVCGRGRAFHEAALHATRYADDSAGEPGPLICRVREDTLSDRAVLGKMRRADRFSKMAMLAAHDAWRDAGGKHPDAGGPVGIVVTTALGPHDTTFKFLDDILDYGDMAVSPTRFTHSVHNAAASYISMTIGIRGPTTTVTKFRTPFAEGLALADAWLQAERCRTVLVGYVEELSPAMEYIAAALHARGEHATLQDFSLSPHPATALSEGAVFMVMTSGEGTLGEWRDLRGLRTLFDRVGR